MKYLTTFVLVIAVVAMIAGDAGAQATIFIEVMDGAGEGFNDLTPWSPRGGNPATTLGQARLNAFQYAANIWAGCLTSSVTIVVQARMDPQACTETSAVLGAAGPVTVYADGGPPDPPMPIPNTWYAQALANAIAGTDLVGTDPDISATFNSNLNGDPGCLRGAGWYYGYDRNPPGNDIDFVTVVMHELGHGLGFVPTVNLTNGAKFFGLNDTYILNLNRAGATPSDYVNMSNAQRVAANTSDPNLRWTGPMVTLTHPTIPTTEGLNAQYVRMYAPSQLLPGSSVSHFSVDVFPDESMEPSYTGSNHDPSLAYSAMADIGWTVDPACLPSAPVAFALVVAAPVGAGIEIRWDLVADEPFDGFNVYRQRTDQDFEIRINGDGPVDPTRKSYVDADVEPGETYRYSVAVIMPDGTERRSPSISATVGAYATHLDQNRPNPFNPSTEISYQIADDQRVRMAIFDASGALVRTLVDDRQPAGAYTVTWNGANDQGLQVSSGVYFYRLQAGKLTQTRRMVLLK